MINSFVDQFKAKIRGKYEPKAKHDHREDVSIGARIKLIFAQLYGDYIGKYRATSEYSDSFIQQTLQAHEGDSIPGFPSIDAFLALIQPQLAKLKSPAHETLNDAFHLVEEVALGLLGKVFQRFPAMVEDLTEIVCKILAQERDKTKKVIDTVIDAEVGYLFTNDIDYLANRTGFVLQTQQLQETGKPNAAAHHKPVDPQKLFLEEMRNRIDSYFALVVRNLRDAVPKAIGHFLVQNSQDNMQFSLYDEINKSTEILDVLGEPPHITQERASLRTMLEVLNKALRHLKKDPE
jgi:hypothetical protein